jgi:hypothetical protein
MPSDKLPPELRAMIEQGPQRIKKRSYVIDDELVSDYGDENEQEFATRIALASLRHAARECKLICADVRDARRGDYGAQRCFERILKYTKSLAEEPMLPEQERSSMDRAAGEQGMHGEPCNSARTGSSNVQQGKMDNAELIAQLRSSGNAFDCEGR